MSTVVVNSSTYSATSSPARSTLSSPDSPYLPAQPRPADTAPPTALAQRIPTSNDRDCHPPRGPGRMGQTTQAPAPCPRPAPSQGLPRLPKPLAAYGHSHRYRLWRRCHYLLLLSENRHALATRDVGRLYPTRHLGGGRRCRRHQAHPPLGHPAHRRRRRPGFGNLGVLRRAYRQRPWH